MTQSLWRLDLQVTPQSAEHFHLALEPFFEAITEYLDDDENPVRLEAYSENKPDLGLVSERLKAVGEEWGIDDPQFSFQEVENRDWLTEYAREHPPLKIGQYFIYGSHYDGKIPAGAIGLHVEAATAFGTGEHATTEGCLKAIADLAKKYRFRNVLDMGCGSAILAMAAVKTWGGAALASDIDVPSVEMARHNLEQNHVAGPVDVLLSDGYQNPAIKLNGPYDLILSNILARPLSTMAKDLACHLQSGGFAVLSGFHHYDAGWVMGAHRCHGLKLVKRIKVREWQTLILRKM